MVVVVPAAAVAVAVVGSFPSRPSPTPPDTPPSPGPPPAHTTRTQVAILAGDFLLARASVSLAALRNPEAILLMSQSLEHLVAGEILQVAACCTLLFIVFWLMGSLLAYLWSTWWPAISCRWHLVGLLLLVSVWLMGSLLAYLAAYWLTCGCSSLSAGAVANPGVLWFARG